MGARRAGSIVISLSAGTAQFVRDMDAADAKVKNFGASAQRLGGSFREMGASGVSEMRATSAAFKTLEGHITNNFRALMLLRSTCWGLDRFCKSISGCGGYCLRRHAD